MFQKLPGFDYVVIHFCLNFFKFQKLGMYHFVPGSNFLRRLNGKVAREQRKNGMGLAPKQLLSSYTLELRKMPLFTRDGSYHDDL